MKLAYREFGEGQPLIILHGLFGQSDNWNTLAKSFALQNLRVFTLDQRNHGLSPHSKEWNYEVMADDLLEFIEDRQLEKPILMGHSMGAKTVMFFDLKYPGIAAKLILVDMAARAYPPHHEIVLKALHAVDFDKIQNRKEAEAILNKYLDDFGTKQFLLKNIYWREEEPKKMDWRFDLETISKNYDQMTVAVPMTQSHTPTFVLNGEKSTYVNEHDRDDFRHRYRHISFETISQAAHWVHAEKPKEFFEAVMRFISGHRS
jgi:esterase